jgi:hypothetical protein
VTPDWNIVQIFQDIAGEKRLFKGKVGKLWVKFWSSQGLFKNCR